MIPALIAAAAAKTVGGLFGGIGQYNDTQRGMTSYRNLANQGITALQQGKADANAAFSPYTDAGKTGVSGLTGATQGYTDTAMSGMPTAQTTTPQGTQAWLDPSADYSTAQANKAMQASALAKGGAGGGLARSLANNAQKMAMTNWNNAAQQQMQANNQNFQQNQQNWQNKFNVANQNVGNWQNLANVGLTATGQNQGLQAQYNAGINSNYLSQAGANQQGWNKKGEIYNKTATDLVNNIGGGIGAIFGGGK